MPQGPPATCSLSHAISQPVTTSQRNLQACKRDLAARNLAACHICYTTQHCRPQNTRCVVVLVLGHRMSAARACFCFHRVGARMTARACFCFHQVGARMTAGAYFCFHRVGARMTARACFCFHRAGTWGWGDVFPKSGFPPNDSTGAPCCHPGSHKDNHGALDVSRVPTQGQQ
eukprot:1133694-Pelagomonas_calceolata.AAC.4